MIEMIFIEVISIVSYIFSLLLFVFKFDTIEKVIFLFGWSILVTIITHYLSKRKGIYNILYLALFIPLFFYKDKNTMLFLILNSIIIVLYAKNTLDAWTHYSYTRMLKKSVIVYIPFIYMRYLLSKYNINLTDVAPFMVIYLITSITLARTLRHLDSNMDLTNIRKNNIKTLLTMPVIFLVSISPGVRETIMSLSNKIIDIIAYPIYMAAFWFENFLNRFANDKYKNTPMEIGQAQTSTDNVISQDPVLDFQKALEKVDDTDLSFISTIFSIILIVLFIYIIYRMIIKSNKSFHKEITYVEEREYIAKEKSTKIKSKKDTMPKDLSGQIRYYYRRFLDKIRKKDMEILNTDSTLDINKKAETAFNQDINRLRDIYIKTRYGKKEATAEMVEEIKDIYKKL